MGSITSRKRKDGSLAYLAQISIMRKGVIFREAQTFDRRPAAVAWVKKRENELSKPGVDLTKRKRLFTLADAIDKYLEDSLKSIGKTKAQVLRTIKTFDIADRECSEIDSPAIISFAQELSGSMQPQTVANYLSHLGAIFAIARPAWGMPLDQQAMKDAFVVAKRLGLTTRSRERNRRPTLDELDKILGHFTDRQKQRPWVVPMTRVIAFAIFSTRRQEEITTIKWDDLDAAHSRILVRDMKNPGEKIGNDVWCDLPDHALAIIKAMPKTAPEIFPYTTDAIGAGFTRACHLLDIKDLRFHDLRHEGVSRLFELGNSIPHAAAVSGHRSWNSLKRYTHLRQAGDKYSGWKWLDAVSKPVGLAEGHK